MPAPELLLHAALKQLQQHAQTKGVHGLDVMEVQLLVLDKVKQIVVPVDVRGTQQIVTDQQVMFVKQEPVPLHVDAVKLILHVM
jgi:hypothetical protein